MSERVPVNEMHHNGGEVFASKVVAKLIGPVSDLGMENCETLCKAALEINGDFVSISNHEATKKTSKKMEKKTVEMMFSKMNSLLPNQLKNQALRFGLEIPPNAVSPRASWGGFKPFGGGPLLDSRDYDDVIDVNILTAPICDICVVQSGDSIPEGYYRIYKTPKNKKANLNSQSGGHPIYLCIRKDLTGGAAPITNFIVFFPDRSEYVPPGYYIVQRGAQACNLNSGTSAERVYLCYKKDLAGNPITDVQVVFPGKGEETPRSFNRVEKSFSGVHANLNSGTNGLEAVFCYRQQLARLAVLLNESAAVLDSPSGSEIPRAKQQHRRASFKMTSAPYSVGSTEDFRRLQIADNGANGNNVKFAAAPVGGGMPPLKSGSEGDLPAFGTDATAATNMSDVATRGSSKSLYEAPSAAVTGGLNLTDVGRERSRTSTSAQSVEEPLTPRVSRSVHDTGSINEGGEERRDEMSPELLADEEGEDGEFYDEGFEGQDAALEAVAEDDGTYSARRNKEVVDVTGKLAPLKSRRSLLAILSAVYVRHGGVAESAVAGLSALLKDTDFFEHDLKGLPLPGTVTMLDLCIETVCDRFDLSAENEHDSLLQLIRTIIKHSGARLSPSSLQRMFRAISFLCNIHSTKSGWIASGASMPCNEPGEMLTPFRVLKHLISDTVAQVELINFSNFLPDTDATYCYEGAEEGRHSQAYLEVRFVVEDLVENIIDSVEASRLSEAAFLAISKQSITTTSGVFWDSVNLISRRLFSDYQNRSAFVTLCAISKQAWMGIRTNSKGEPIPRDLGIKLIALEAITEFCLCAGDKMRNNKIMGYQIRRIVVPCILYNVNYALVDHKIFSKLLKIVTALWKKWRHCVRIEFAILCEQLIIRVLQATVVQIRPIFQMIVIQEVINWFDQPHLLVEMFVNYDMDRKFVSHWNTFSHLVRTVCAIGRRLTLVTGAWDWRPGGANAPAEESHKISITIRDVHLQALEEVGHIAKTLMDASGHAYLIMQDEGFRNRSLGATGGWIEDDETGSSNGGRSRKDSPGPAGDETTNLNDGSPAPSTGRKRVGSVRMRRALHQEAEELIKEAIKIYREKDSLKKAIAYLIKQNFMADTPQEITNFLRVYKNSFDPAAIGEFLGEGGVTPREVDYWSQIRFRYTRAVSFVEMDVEPALRLYLTGCGFRLPGEAQKIDRFVEVFVKAFWQDNGGTHNCPFKHQDTVHLLAYATIMLNTDLHRANLDAKKRSQKMSKEQFVNNLRGADQGSNIDRDYLCRIYDNIEAHAIELDVAVKPTAPATVTAAITAALPLAGKKGADEDKKVVMGGDMAANAMASGGKAVTADVRIAEEKKFIRELCRSLRDSEDLLRSLSPFTYRFQSGLLSLDLVSCMYETVWFHFHAIAESLLTAPITDTYVKFAALDILCYSLTSAIFLDLKVERMTFADLLKAFRETVEKGPRNPSGSAGNGGSNGDKPPAPDNSWYEEVENANQYTSMDTIAKVHHLMVHIKDTIQETSSYELTRQVASRFEKKARILENNIFFVRQGDLVKLNRAARPVSYKFFLFSDYLIYAHQSRNEYRVHEQLSLNAMTISDNETDVHCTSFYVSHPVKSFFVVAESPLAKQQWMRDINQTIDSCRKREKTKTAEGMKRRMSIYERIDHQQSAQGNVIAPAYAASPDRKTTHSNDPQAVPRTNSRYIDTSASSDTNPADFQAVPFSTTPVKQQQLSSNFSTPAPAESSPPPKAPTPTLPLPTPEQRALAQAQAVESFSETIKYLSGDPLNSLYHAGVTFYKGMLNTRGGANALSESQQLRLFGLYRHVKKETARLEGPSEQQGAAGVTSPAVKEPPLSADQQRAWEECAGLSCEEAKRQFLTIVFSVAPYWKYEQFM